jgi:hypothetical protein
MRPMILLICLIGTLGAGTLWLGSRAAPIVPQHENMGSSSVMFIENVGQFGRGALYQSQSEVGVLFMAQEALWLTILEPPTPVNSVAFAGDVPQEQPARGGVHLRLTFVGSNPQVEVEASDRLTGSINYFTGSDPTQWHTDVPVWGTVYYRDLYPGIDLELSSVAGRPIRRLVVRDSTRATLTDIVLQVEGAEAVSATAAGMEIATPFGTRLLPYFELVDGKGMPLEATPVAVSATTIQLPVQAPTKQAVAGEDALLPSNLLYASYLGGSEGDDGLAIDVAPDGGIVIGGVADSTDFPTTPGTFDPTASGYSQEGFVTKLSPDGRTLAFSTYLSGGATDKVYALEVDQYNRVVVIGHTFSPEFPTTPNAPTPPVRGQISGYVLRLYAQGNALEYGMFLGSVDIASATNLALGADGSAYVSGLASGTGFPVTPGAYDTSDTGVRRAFLTHVAADGRSLLYSTRLGGTDTRSTEAYAVDVDAQGHAYLMGFTRANDFPTTPGTYDPVPGGPQYFVTKFTPDGSDLVYSTLVPGDVTGGHFHDITVNGEGFVYVATHTIRPFFPATAGAYDTECGYQNVGCGNPQGASDGVLFKLNPDASEMVYGTYLGGSGQFDAAYEVEIDEHGNAYVVGGMTSAEVHPTAGGYNTGPTYGAVWKISADGSQRLHMADLYLTYALTLEREGVVVIAGTAASGAFEPTADAYDATPNGQDEAIVVRMALPASATTTTLTVAATTLASSVDHTVYHFPANSISETALFTHAPRHPLSLPPVAPHLTVGAPFVNYAIGTASETALQPLQPYTLDIYYEPSDLGGQSSVLGLYYWDGSAWIPEPSTLIDPTTHHILATPSRFGWWVILRHPDQIYLPAIRR